MINRVTKDDQLFLNDMQRAHKADSLRFFQEISRVDLTRLVVLAGKLSNQVAYYRRKNNGDS